VIGIIHTNYYAYVKGTAAGWVFLPIVSALVSLLARSHCHQIVKLSGTLQTFAKEKECIMNVHGIRQDFLEEGKRRALAQSLPLSSASEEASSGKVYFIGKLLWAKGLDMMIELENAYKNVTDDYFEIDIIGSGPEEEEIRRAFLGSRARSQPLVSEEDCTVARSESVKDTMDRIINEMPRSRFEFRKDCIPAHFLGRKDHAVMREEYKIFVNPSTTEVLCTTTAEVRTYRYIISPLFKMKTISPCALHNLTLVFHFHHYHRLLPWASL